MSVYYATKAFVVSFSQAIANELEGTGVTTTALYPGPSNTGFAKRAKLQRSRLFTRQVMSAETVAKAGYVGLMKGKAIVIPGIRNHILAKSVRFVPRKLVVKTVRKMQE